MAKPLEPRSYNQALDRLPPMNLMAETAVLGSALMDPRALDSVLELLEEADFFKSGHRLIFRAIKELNEKNLPVDLVTVQEYLGDKKQLEGVGGPVGLASLSDKVASATNVESYAKLVKDKAKLRQMITVAQAMIADAYARPEETSLVLDHAEHTFMEVMMPRGSGFQAADRLVDEHLQEQEKLRAMKKTRGLDYGHWALQAHTGGMRPGQMIVIGGRPGAGKTALMLNIAAEALEQRNPVGIISLEMTRDELLTRMACSHGSIDAGKAFQGSLEAEEWDKYKAALNDVRRWPLHINDDSTLTIGRIKSAARALVRNKGIKLLVIDYLQLLSADGFGTDSRTAELSFVSKQIKQIAKTLPIPVLVGSQLNRKMEDRDKDREPRLADLKDTGSIEQDADVVFLIHKKKDGDAYDYWINTAKQRSGPTDMKPIDYQGEFVRFKTPLEPWKDARYWKNRSRGGK